jgi:DNA-binding GntR family transcriptional regulator
VKIPLVDDAQGVPLNVRTLSDGAQAPRPEPRLEVVPLVPERGRPLHGQLEAGLRELIRSGEVEPGSRLPGEHELAARFGVSRHTIRHALGVLAQEGLVRRQRGRGGGTRVTPPDERTQLTERALTGFYAFAWELQARGAEQRSFVLERTSMTSSDFAERLEAAPDTPLQKIVRLRTADGEPLVLETSVLPEELAQALDQDALERGSIYDTLERLRGVRIVRAHETIRPVALERAVARLLGVRAGSPAFAIERRTFTERGPIEWQESIVRGDRYLYSVELPRRAM